MYMNRELLEKKLAELPILQYEFIKTADLMFSDKARYICETECPMYGTTWACPPGVGTVDECRERCMQYENALLITTITEVNDIANMEETLSTRADHEDIARQVRALVNEYANETFVLSTEACTHCGKCTYPNAPCRHPDKMFPCIESHGIIVTDLAEKYEIPFISGNLVTWFSIIFYK